MSDVLTKFGRYFLLDLLAQGGMAEIYRARYASADGAGRLLVIKRIQKDYGAQSEFLQMFRSEIKVSMGLNHPNIIQLFDYGEEQGQPFIAMEFVDGRNLRQILNRCGERREPFSIELAVSVMEAAVAGLEFAHTYRDKISGEHLKIVHRDISPQNIIVSYEGLVKVIDFGIAKAKTNSEHTRAGVIKGKPSYLSPEQITGDPLDGRTDQFALGAVFWELLTGRKLFAGDNDLAVLKLIEGCSSHVTPPSKSNPAVPPELDEIVLKMLARAPEDRYQTGAELERIIRNFIRNHYPDYGQAEASKYLKEIFQKEIVEDRKKIQRLNDKVEQLLMTDIPDLEGTRGPPRSDESIRQTQHATLHPKDTVRAPVPQNSGPQAAPFSQAAPVTSKREDATTQMATQTQKATHRSVEFEVNSANTLPRVVLDPAVVRKRAPSQSQTQSTTKSTSVSKSESTHNSSPFLSLMGWGVLGAAVFVTAKQGPKYGFEVPVLSQLLGASVKQGSADRQQSGQTVLPDGKDKQAPSKSQNSQTLKFVISPDDVSVIAVVNGEVLEESKRTVNLQLGQSVDVSVERPGYSNFKTSFVYKGEPEYVLQLKPLGHDTSTQTSVGVTEVGYLTVRAQFSAEAFIYDKDEKPVARKFIPFEKLSLPVGKYRVKLVSEVLDFVDETTLQVEQGRTTSYDGVLKPRNR